jgi:Zn-dependent protease
MLLGEPPRSSYDLNFSLLGIPVRIHPFFWLIGLFLAPRNEGPAAVLVWMVAFFVGILCHEIGHALVMRSQGHSPWITLYGLGGMASYDPLQSRSSAEASEWRQIAISAAGPLAGFLLAAIVIALVQALGYHVIWLFGAPTGIRAYAIDILHIARQPQWIEFVNALLFVTIVYGILNLLPVYPLDGGQIAREIFVLVLGADGVRQSLILSTIVAGGLAALSAAKWHEFFMAFFFGYLAYASFATLQAYTGRRPW